MADEDKRNYLDTLLEKWAPYLKDSYIQRSEKIATQTLNILTKPSRDNLATPKAQLLDFSMVPVESPGCIPQKGHPDVEVGQAETDQVFEKLRQTDTPFEWERAGHRLIIGKLLWDGELVEEIQVGVKPGKHLTAHGLLVPKGTGGHGVSTFLEALEEAIVGPIEQTKTELRRREIYARLTE